LLVAVLPACAAPPSVAVDEAALSTGRALDDAPGAMIVGASADRRFVAYATGCTPDSSTPTALKIRDDLRGRTTTVGQGQCRPGAVQFSPDGQLAGFSNGDGIVRVFSARSGAVVVVSREGESGFALAFSPDSRWLVVASAGEPPAATLDAWDADLSHHVEVAQQVYVNPFGNGSDSVRFSPDGRRILFVGGVTTPYPIGALTLWERASGTSTVLARGVAAWMASDDLSRVAYLDGVTLVEGQPPSVWLHGELAVRTLASGRVERVEADAPAEPQRFLSDGTLLYLVGAPSGGEPSYTLKAHQPGRAPLLLDDGVFRGWAPGSTLAVSPCGSAVAYVAAFVPEHSAGELRVATLPSRAGVAARPRLVSAQAVPSAFGWVGEELVYLHDPTEGFPGTAVGTLARWSLDGGHVATIAKGATQVGLRIDGDNGRVLYLTAWDQNRAAGDLRVWAPAGPSRMLAHDVFAMSLGLSPDGDLAGALTVGTDAPPGTPPATALVLAPLDGGAVQRIAPDITSFVVADSGRVVYAGVAGLFGRGP
jgi:hypothetical protein